MKEIEEDINKWKDIMCSWIGRISIVNIYILPKETYRVSVISIKIPMRFFTIIEKNNPKIYMEPQKTLNSQSNLEKEKQTWRDHIA